jgi:hypothetical protein
VVVVTSLPTLVSRHGPGERLKWRIANKGFSTLAAEAVRDVLDIDWEFGLSDLFELITIDEAHVIKNDTTASHCTVRWLNSPFILLVTASVLPNRIEDFAGYIPFLEPLEELWSSENLQKWGKVDGPNLNPFLFADDDPACCLRMTTRAVKRWITGEKKNLKKAGYYLGMIWEQCMIRRTYASPNPQYPEQKIGDSIAHLFSRRIVCRFNMNEEKKYEAISALSYKKLITVLNDGTRVWNRKHARKLILNSTWLGFHWIENDITAETIGLWKASSTVLYDWVKFLRKRMEEKGETELFVLPEPHEIGKLLAIICRGSPKIRATLRVIAELVILVEKKLILWCSIPANQVLLYSIFQAMDIGQACYTSELSRDERSFLVTQFTKNRKCCVFIGSYFVGSYGLNLQYQCHHHAFFDGYPNSGARAQARGRDRRIGQPYPVEEFEIYVENSFQNRVIQNTVFKTLPGAMAELSINLEEVDETFSSPLDEKMLEISEDWYLIDDELVKGGDPRMAHLPKSRRLTPEGLIAAIINTQRGTKIDAALWERQEIDDELLKEESAV